MPAKNTTIRYFLTITACTLLVWMSCKKPEAPAIDYSISGVKDVSLSENGSETIPLDIKLLTSNAEQVTLSVAGLPTGVSASFNLTTGEPPFKSNLYIKDDSSTGGSYDITLNAKSATGIAHDYSFKLNTLPKTCAAKLSGLYTGTNICKDGNGQGFNTIEFKQDDEDKDKMYFLWNKSLLYIIINCNKNLVTLPLQTFEDRKIQGSGYVDQNYSVISFNFTEYLKNGDSINCDGYYFKKK